MKIKFVIVYVRGVGREGREVVLLGDNSRVTTIQAFMLFGGK